MTELHSPDQLNAMLAQAMQEKQQFNDGLRAHLDDLEQRCRHESELPAAVKAPPPQRPRKRPRDAMETFREALSSHSKRVARALDHVLSQEATADVVGLLKPEVANAVVIKIATRIDGNHRRQDCIRAQRDLTHAQAASAKRRQEAVAALEAYRRAVAAQEAADANAEALAGKVATAEAELASDGPVDAFATAAFGDSAIDHASLPPLLGNWATVAADALRD